MTYIHHERLVRFMVLVGDPNARVRSAFFENPSLFASELSLTLSEVAELTALFLSRYPHEVPLPRFGDGLTRTLRLEAWARAALSAGG